MVRLDVGGEIFHAPIDKLLAVEGSLFEAELGKHDPSRLAGKTLQIARTMPHFKTIMRWLRDPRGTPLPHDDPTFMLDAAYFGMALALAPSATMVVAGGWCGLSGVTAAVECYDLETKRWSNAGALLGKRSYHASALLGGDVYVAGGEQADNSEQAGTATAEVLRYDAKRAVWKQCASMVGPRHGVALVAANRSLYAIGGISGSSRKCKSRVERYTLSDGRWRKVASLPAPRSGMAAAALQGSIYVVGGWDGRACLTSVLRYDCAANEWSEVAPMQKARYGLSCCAVGGMLYAIGGGVRVEEESDPTAGDPANGGGGAADGGSRTKSTQKKKHTKITVLDVVEVFDPKTGRWKTGVPLEVPRMCAASAAYKGRIYVCGGQDAGKAPLDRVEIFSTSSKTWRAGVSMVEPRTAHTMAFMPS